MAFPVDPVAVVTVAVALHQRPSPVRDTANHLPRVRGPFTREGRGLSEVADAEHHMGMPDANARNRIGAAVALFKSEVKIVFVGNTIRFAHTVCLHDKTKIL